MALLLSDSCALNILADLTDVIFGSDGVADKIFPTYIRIGFQLLFVGIGPACLDQCVARPGWCMEVGRVQRALRIQSRPLTG